MAIPVRPRRLILISVKFLEFVLYNAGTLKSDS
jgi:hypothetical protein